MEKDARIFVAGGSGLVGSTIIRELIRFGYIDIISNYHRRRPIDFKGNVKFSQLDILRQDDVEKFFSSKKPDYVFLAAARVGGILANDTYKADFIYENIMIAANIIRASEKSGVKKLLNLGSSCIYPKFAPQPMKESYLLTGELEPTNEPYAIAKIAAIKLCRYFNEQYGTNYLSVMPTNIYGPGDNFDLKTSHVLPAFIRKFYEAKSSGKKSVTLWGTGEPFREFLYVDDLADACVYLMNNYDYKDMGEFVNIGTGKDIKIKDLAGLIKRTVGFDGEIKWDPSKPDGTPKKLLDVSRVNALGWKANTKLEEGIRKIYEWYKDKAD